MDSPEIETRQFTGKRIESEATLEGLSAISQAGLNQFSLERMTGYGVDYADAIELRARIVDGADWKEAAEGLAQEVLDLIAPTTPAPTQRNQLCRASALLRMGQMMLLSDTEERVGIYKRAAQLYERAIAFGSNRERITIDGPFGPMAGWLIPSTAVPAIGSCIVFGGVEGWAMDFDTMGEALAARGIEALMLDCPGQGETRFAHGHYLNANWQRSLEAVIDYLEVRLPNNPIGIIGNSMGGSLAMTVAGADPRIAACCNNGGVIKPSMGRMVGGAFFAKMVAFCGTDDEDAAEAIWDSVTPLHAPANPDYPLLVVQGGHDPLVPTDHAQTLLQMAPTRNKRMVLFSDGNHCIYNHLADRDNLIADWMLEQLSTSSSDQN